MHIGVISYQTEYILYDYRKQNKEDDAWGTGALCVPLLRNCRGICFALMMIGKRHDGIELRMNRKNHDGFALRMNGKRHNVCFVLGSLIGQLMQWLA